MTGEFGLGIDLAYQWTRGPLYIAVVAGIGTGFVFGTNSFVSAYTGPLFTSATAGGWSPTVALNLHLVRIGYAF